jgi:RNA polymerase sigma factor (sigma-70 family)
VARVDQTVELPSPPTQVQVQSSVKGRANGPYCAQRKSVEVTQLSSCDRRLGQARKEGQIALRPATAASELTDHQAGASIVHEADYRDPRLSPTYLQPNASSLCYPDVCMDDLPARLVADLDTAFPDLVRGYQNLVFGVALRVVADAASAEDVAQEVFVRAYRALKRFPTDRLEQLQPKAWLAKITLNQARTHVKTRKRHEPLDGIIETARALEAGPVQLAERRDERRMWARLLSNLPDRYRLPVALRHVDGLSYEELSATLDRPLGSVKSDVHRGVALLRAAYDAEQRGIAQKEAV